MTDERERVWATGYLTHEAGAEAAAARDGARKAATIVKDALAQQPWVEALIEYAIAQKRSDIVFKRIERAHMALGTEPPRPPNVPLSIADWRDGVPSPGFLIRPLIDLIDDAADVRAAELIAERDAEVDAIISDDDAIARSSERNEADLERAAIDPAFAVSVGTSSDRIEVRTVDIDGVPHTVHRNIDTLEQVAVGPDGKVHKRPTVWRSPLDSPPDWTQLG
ncbi:hypothetical protein [Rhodococcus sp. AQ5-07]|uniref:hypothetical protein n=1 Tax=Rhodococcus sp. AQ5-07 TaxID=2054902 RepID=UPI000DC04827|nr:hypothetical protein [Rhodococcus sp. AQ5-07]RAL32872.1 hypothetical protein CVN56_21215 [Rhodococcus sp. AQ5-07]